MRPSKVAARAKGKCQLKGMPLAREGIQKGSESPSLLQRDGGEVLEKLYSVVAMYHHLPVSGLSKQCLLELEAGHVTDHIPGGAVGPHEAGVLGGISPRTGGS